MENTGPEKNIETIGIIGAGTMGNGIAQAAAQAGFIVIMEDISEEVVKNGFEEIKNRLEERIAKGKMSGEERDAILSRIKLATTLEELKDADLIIEAATEDMKTKEEIFMELDRICSKETIFASNTSSLSIMKMATASIMTTSRLEKFVGMHFTNPANIMKLVEVAGWYYTDPKIIETVEAVAKKMGKTPIIVSDTPGFVLNALLFSMINTAMKYLEKELTHQKNVDPAKIIENIDTIMKLGAGHPMGPLELADFVGLDVCLKILKNLESEDGGIYAPPQLLKEMVKAGTLGRKTGKGFYEYPEK